MRRTRRDGTKVWHNPEVETFSRRKTKGGSQPAEGGRVEKQHRAALEALFAPRPEPDAAGARPPASGKAGREATGGKAPSRIVLTPPPAADPKTAERQRLLSRLLLAEGRPGISKAANEFLRAGFTFPDEQDVYLQLLEHADEDLVRTAMSALTTLLLGELPKRRAVLDSRLRRLEEFAEDEATRSAAQCLRRRVAGRPAANPAGTAGTP
jgi:uncharacterized small protein (DUF1192 family)